ncbi:MAG: hypothetical protein A3J83_02695 [Elusimicrobia bacterium RIFOXYA2_FULL_40_6]|nr:MAG: hypothetical protein A3J83_02695 [Elusimicrobia bacterium RIFOXYA2_FULL_40_6]
MKIAGIAATLIIVSFQSCFAAAQKQIPGSKVTVSTTSAYEISVDTRTNLDKLLDKNTLVRLNAIRALSTERNKNYLKNFLGLLNDKNQEIRKQAIDGLVEIGSADDIGEPVLKLLKSEKEMSVKISCINALSKIKYEPSIKYLLALTDDQNPLVRTYSLSAIGEYGLPETYALIQSKIKDPAEGVKLIAIKYCVKLQIKSAVPLIIELLKYPVVSVRRESVIAVGELGDRSNRKNLEKLLLDKDESVVSAAKDAIDKINSR